MNRKLGLAFLLILLALILSKRVEVKPLPTADADINRPLAAIATASSVSPTFVKPSANDTSEIRNPLPTKPLTIEEAAFCKLQSLNTGVPMGGRLKLVTLQYAKPDGHSGDTVILQSSECADGAFSTVRIDSEGGIEEVIGCDHRGSLNVRLKSGIQGEISYVESKPNTLNLALSGDGYFLAACDGEVVLQRRGSFILDSDSGVKTSEGCQVLDVNGEAFRATKGLDAHGCTGTGGPCVAVVDPSNLDIEYVDRTTLKARGNPLRGLVARPALFTGAAENFEDPLTGPLGPDFDKLPEFHPPAQCP